MEATLSSSLKRWLLMQDFEVFLIVEEIMKKLCGEGEELILPSSRCLTVFVYMLSVA